MRLLANFRVILIVSVLSSYAQVALRTIDDNLVNKCWIDDDIKMHYVGAGMIVKDSSKDINIIKKDTAMPYLESDSSYRDELSLMSPYHLDSAITIFDTTIGEYPDTVNIGKYPQGKRLIFRYRIIQYDGSDFYLNPNGGYKNYYTGQNRRGVDYYISDRGSYLNYCNSASAQLNDSVVATGFDPNHASIFSYIYFTVENAQMTGVDVFKISRPKLAIPSDTSFVDSVSVELYIPYRGNYLQTDASGGVRDLRPDSTAFQIYYTTDGTDPSDTANANLYNDEPIVIRETTTLKAIGVLPYQPDSTTWYPSPVTEWKIADSTTSVDRSPGKTGYRIKTNPEDLKHVRTYDIRGRIVEKGVDKSSVKENKINGVYIDEFRTDKGTIKKKTLIKDD